MLGVINVLLDIVFHFLAMQWNQLGTFAIEVRKLLLFIGLHIKFAQVGESVFGLGSYVLITLQSTECRGFQRRVSKK
jgi:hypothetical protein